MVRSPVILFAARAALFVALQCGICAMLVRLTYRSNQDGYMAATIDKHARLDALRGERRLFVAGGSASAFGFDSGAIEAATGRKVVNVGLHAELGLPFILLGLLFRQAAGTLAWVRRGDFEAINGGNYFPPRFDTRHNLSVVATYAFTPRWQATATWVYTSGYASWLPAGRFTLQDIPGAPFQTVVPIYGDRNTFRYPAYMRLDLGLVYKWKTRRTSQDITLSIYNATDRRNPYFIYLEPQFQTVQQGDAAVDIPTAIRAQQVSLFPVLPSITWNFKF
jgi:hypothetical protein